MRTIARFFAAHPRLQLPVLLAAPVGWLLIAYLGSLAILLASAFWRLDPFSGTVSQDWNLDNFAKLTSDTNRGLILKTIGLAAAVTVTDAILAFPIAYYMARIASPRTRRYLVVAVLIPLWAAYLVKVYAWRVLLQQSGLINSVLGTFGLRGPGYSDIALWLVFSYLWLPYMILPIFAGLERIPGSLLEASGDLGARSATTFRRVILPLVFPAVVAGSIFTFSLTLGDYIAPALVSSSEVIGTVVQRNLVANVPLAAAIACVPIAIMIVYLLIARRLGAFESL